MGAWSMSSFRIFTKRYEKAIFGRELVFSLSKRVRRRIWMLLERWNNSYVHYPIPGNNWQEVTSVLEQLPAELCYRYGVDQLEAFAEGEDGKREATNLEGFVTRGYANQVFDVVELFREELPDDQKSDFERDLNNLLEEERVDWRMLGGHLIRIDSEFLELDLMAQTQNLLGVHGLEGPTAEFVNARNDLAAGDVKGAIHKACNSMESVLKSLLERSDGNASTLIRQLYDSGFYDGMPDEFARSFGEQVLMALPFLRNRLGGHGQGPTIVDVPDAYGQLAIHLSAAFSHFLVRQWFQQNPREPENEPESAGPWEFLTEDDVPF